MKILLINPPFYRFIGLEQDYVPLSLLSVGSSLVEQGQQVYLKNLEIGPDLHYEGYFQRSDNYSRYIYALHDENHPVWKELEKTINDIDPQIIGINVLSVKYQSVLKIIKHTWHKDIRIVVGGHHIMNDPWFPSGIEYFKGEYESFGKRVKNLDDLPYPYFNILMDHYSPDGYAHIITSRGCPFSCRYCASKTMWGKLVTYKSALRIIKEMRFIYDQFKPDCFTIWDEVFTLNKKRLYEFCSNYNVPSGWRCDTRADLLDEEKILMMSASGCSQLSLGIECSDNMILKKIGKNETTKDFKKAAELLHKYNIQWKAYCILGFPYDTESSIINTIEFIKSLKPARITISYFTPYKGTEMFDEVKAMGMISDQYDTNLYSHQSPYNYFCPNIPRNTFDELKNIVTQDIDNYNKEALKIWK